MGQAAHRFLCKITGKAVNLNEYFCTRDLWIQIQLIAVTSYSASMRRLQLRYQVIDISSDEVNATVARAIWSGISL